MSDLISRREAINEIVRWGKLPEWDENERNLLGSVIGMLSTIPSPEQKHGKWMLWNEPGNEYAWCTACGEKFDQDDLYIGGRDYPKYCPECGARMEEEK